VNGNRRDALPLARGSALARIYPDRGVAKGGDSVVQLLDLGLLVSGPVVGRSGKHGLAARRLRCPVEGVGGRAPDGVVGCRPMGLQCGLVAVDFVEVVDVLVLLVLQYIEPQAAGLVTLGTQRIDLDRFQEALALLRLPEPSPTSPACGLPSVTLRHAQLRGRVGRRHPQMPVSAGDPWTNRFRPQRSEEPALARPLQLGITATSTQG
jgi:hypothetical protein